MSIVKIASFGYKIFDVSSVWCLTCSSSQRSFVMIFFQSHYKFFNKFFADCVILLSSVISCAPSHDVLLFICIIWRSGYMSLQDPAEVLFVKGSLPTQRFLTVVQMQRPELTESLSRELWMRIWNRVITYIFPFP